MDKPRLYIDSNNMFEKDLVVFSGPDIKVNSLGQDFKIDSSGQEIKLYEGLRVSIYMDDWDVDGNEDNLIAEGQIERISYSGVVSKWGCRIDHPGLQHESEVNGSQSNT